MKSIFSILGLMGLSFSSGATFHGKGDLPTQVIPEPRQAVVPVIPERRQTTCQYSLDFTSVGQQYQIRSPNYPSSYPSYANCKYSLKSPVGSTIRIACNEFSVKQSSSCQYDKFRVSLSGDQNLMDAQTVCGKGKFEWISMTNALTVGFTSSSNFFDWFNVYKFSCTLTAVNSSSPAIIIIPAPSSTTPIPASSAATTRVSAPTSTIAPENPSPSTASTHICTCGLRNEAARIVGGSQAGKNEFPWRCHLFSPITGQFCGATVISSQWLLTAAHCTEPYTRFPTNLYINCGDHDLTTNSEVVNQYVKVSRIVQHPSYNNTSEDNDISLLQLETPLNLSRTIQPVCLPWNLVNTSLQGKSVVASGWGTTSSGGNQSMILKKVDLPILTTQECQGYLGHAITNNMICTYNPGEDTCQGDSGGSIDYKDPNTGKYNAVGVVSWGIGCGETYRPGVYAKLINYLNYIETETAETFCKV